MEELLLLTTQIEADLLDLGKRTSTLIDEHNDEATECRLRAVAALTQIQNIRVIIEKLIA